jgi:hypothetical protein
MRGPCNDLLGRLAREVAALAASFVPLAAISGAAVTLLRARRAEGMSYGLRGRPNRGAL